MNSNLNSKNYNFDYSDDVIQLNKNGRNINKRISNRNIQSVEICSSLSFWYFSILRLSSSICSCCFFIVSFNVSISLYEFSAKSSLYSSIFPLMVFLQTFWASSKVLNLLILLLSLCFLKYKVFFLFLALWYYFLNFSF